jgi:hypothetical protein
MTSNITADSRRPGDVEIIELSAEKFDGRKKYDIRSIVGGINISMGLNIPNIYANMILVDGIDMFNNDVFTFTGEEFVNLTIRRTGTDFSFSYRFIVGKLGTEYKSPNGDSAVGLVSLLSVDRFVNSTAFKSKGYSGSITEIIKSVLETELYTKIPVSRFVDTEGSNVFAFTEIKPFEKIELLVSKSFNNSPAVTSNFLFYEDLTGYNFEPFEDIMDRAIANTTPIQYSHSPLAAVNREIDTNTILAFNPKQAFDNHRRLYHGLYNSNVKSFDFITKSVKVESISLLDRQAELKHLDRSDPGVSSNFSNKVKNLGSLTYFIPTDLTLVDNTAKGLLNNSPLAILIDENTLEIKTFGNLSYNIGDPIIISILDNRPLDNTSKGEDPRYSGKYVIHSITYSIGIDQAGYMMYNNMVLVRDGAIRSVEFYNNQYSIDDIDIDAIKNSQ